MPSGFGDADEVPLRIVVPFVAPLVVPLVIPLVIPFVVPFVISFVVSFLISVVVPLGAELLFRCEVPLGLDAASASEATSGTETKS